MEDLTTLFYKPTKFNPHEKGIENYQTEKKESIMYKRLLPKSSPDARLDHKARSGKIWEERNPCRHLASKLKEGEFAVVERKYAEVGMFDFTTRNNKIITVADVAFIFRQLETKLIFPFQKNLLIHSIQKKSRKLILPSTLVKVKKGT